MLRLATASLLAAASAVALAASAPVGTEQVPLDVQLRAARSDAAAATAEQRRLEKAAGQARDEASRLAAQQLAAAQAISAAEAQITAADAEARLVEAQLALQRQRLARQQAPVSSLLAGLALMARRPPVLLLADGGSAEDLVKLRLLIAATAPVIRARTGALSAQLERGSRLHAAQLAARDAIVRSRDELAQRRQSFAELEARAIAMAQKRGGEALGAGDVALARQEQLSEIEENASSGRSAGALAGELADLGAAPLAAARIAERAPITYVLPADAPVTDGLGAVSESGVRSRGITLATRRGSPLIAPGSGTILFSGPFRDYDGVIIIDHGGGWKTVLVNAGSNFRRGDRVAIGQPLGIALGPVEVQLQQKGRAVSPALIAGSSQKLSNISKGG